MSTQGHLVYVNHKNTASGRANLVSQSVVISNTVIDLRSSVSIPISVGMLPRKLVNFSRTSNAEIRERGGTHACEFNGPSEEHQEQTVRKLART